MSTGAEVEVETLLDELARRGIQIELGPDDKLKLSGKGKPPAELLERLREAKPRVVAVLRRQTPTPLLRCADTEHPTLGSRNERGELILTVADLPELEQRLRLQGWKVVRRGNELVCTSRQKARIQ